MNASIKKRCSMVVAGVVAATALAACGGSDHSGGSSGTTPPPPTGGSPFTNFSSFAMSVYANAENTTPVNFDSVMLAYDVNEDPTAFNALLM